MQEAFLSNPLFRRAVQRRVAGVLLIVAAGASLVCYFMPPAATRGTDVPAQSADTLPAGLRRLLKAYPGQFDSATTNALIWKDGTVMPYDDGIAGKDYDALLLNADLEDQMNRPYVKGIDFPDPTAPGADTNRVRFTPFFEKMYGKTREEVSRNLAVIRWLPRTQNLKMHVTRINNVHKRLKAVSDELEKHPELLKYVRNPGGTFNWRNIRGTERRSTHSFGIAVDINIRYADYWLWDRELGRPHRHKNRYPLAIIELFEKHGFIWGGKWYYYDTMHFEYRPEMLVDDSPAP